MFTPGSGGDPYSDGMFKRPSTAVLVTVVVIILVAVVIRYWGEPLWDTLASLHGPRRH